MSELTHGLWLLGEPRGVIVAAMRTRVLLCAITELRIVFLLLNVGACAPKFDTQQTDTTQSSGDVESTAAAADTGILPTDTGEVLTTTGSPPEMSPFDELAKCEVETICEPYFHPHTGSEPYHEGGNDADYLDVEKCFLMGLRDGLVGRYVFGTHFDDGTLDDYVIIVHVDRQITFAEHVIGITVDENGVHQVDDYEPALTCELQDVGFFSNCLQNYDSLGHYDLCMQGWWRDCTPSLARCE